jgi:branched-chain amino acid transport system substrate-binding protein
MVKKRRGLILLLLIVPLVFCSACTKPQPLTIGFVASLTGSTSELGVNGRNGLLLAVADVNAAGGVNGRRVEVQVRDDQNDPATGLAIDQELYDRGIRFLIGHMTSNMAALSLPYITKQQMLLINPTMSGTSLLGRDDGCISVVSSNADQAELICRSMNNRGVGKKLAVIYETQNRAYTETVKTAVVDNLAATGGAIISEEGFLATDHPDYLALAGRTLAAEPDAILILASSFDSAMFCQQFYKLGCTQPLYLSSWAMNNDLILQGGQAVEGVMLPSIIDSESQNPAYLAFRNSYRNEYGAEPTFAALYSYEAAQLLFDTMAETGSDDPQIIKAAILKKGGFDGLQGPVTIDAFGDAHRALYTYTIKNGQFVKADQ